MPRLPKKYTFGPFATSLASPFGTSRTRGGTGATDTQPSKDEEFTLLDEEPDEEFQDVTAPPADKVTEDDFFVVGEA